MSRVRCTCGVLLSLPPGILTMRCPRCYATVVCPQTRQLSPISTNGKKRAVLIGISYQGQPNSVNYQSAFNVWWMTQFLVRFLGFPRGSVVVLSDVQFQASKEPTKENIRSAFESLMDDCQQGDSLVFFCSGRDTQGRISAAEIYDAIVKPLPRGAKLHAIIDTCRGGTFPGLPFVYKMNNNQGNTWERVDQQTSTADQGTSGGTAICFSTGEDTTASTSDDVSGALTSSFIGAVKMERNLTYVRLLQSIHTKCCETQNRLNRSESSNTSSVLQVPQLSSSEPLDITSTLSI